MKHWKGCVWLTIIVTNGGARLTDANLLYYNRFVVYICFVELVSQALLPEVHKHLRRKYKKKTLQS